MRERETKLEIDYEGVRRREQDRLSVKERETATEID